MNKHIMVQLKVPGFHGWPEAPERLHFLRHPHRHMFTFKAYARVKHHDRQLEFFEQQVVMRDWLEASYPKWTIDDPSYGYHFGRRSCEQLAEEFLKANQWAVACEVWEDDENGACVEREFLA
jgi:hypothetical protein